MLNLKYDANEPMQTHRHKEQTCGCQGERAGEGMEWEFWG